MKTQLLVIDPQNDFCDLPARYLPIDPATGMPSQPALPVPGAHADMQGLAHFIEAAVDDIDALTITLDSHPSVAIERPGFWLQADGREVPPFTQISHAELLEGRYRPREASLAAEAEAYLRALEARGKYRLMVWPTHCVTGTWGHNLHADLARAVARWELSRQRAALRVLKGQHPLTEAYSAVRAEVPREDDPGTQTHAALLQRLQSGERLLVAGEASSHCVAATLYDLFELLPPGRLADIVVLRDCTSPVTGFEAAEQALFDRCRALGVRVSDTAEVLASLASSPAG